MSLADYVIMPGADYQAICDAIREKTETTEPIKSGDAAGMIQAFQGGGASGNVAKGICEGLAFDLTGDNVEFVADKAFCYDSYGTSYTGFKTEVKSVNLPNATSIGEQAFRLQPKLTSVKLSKVVTIGDQAFWSCDKLKIVECSDVTEVGSEAFSKCLELTSVKAATVGSLGETSFQDCPSLEKFDADSVDQMGNYAFLRCTSLTSVILRGTEQVSALNFAAFDNTPLFSGTGFIYVPSVLYEEYRSNYEFIFDYILNAPGMFDVVFRKIEDYPEICG